MANEIRTRANYVFGVTTSSLSASESGYASVVLNDAPLGYWKLDEASGPVAADYSGNNRSLTFSTAPVRGVSSLLPGDSGYAATFAAGQSSTLSAFPATASGITLEAWFTTTSGSNVDIIMRDNGGNVADANRHFWFRLLGGQLVAYFFSPAISGYVTLTSPATVNDGVPHHGVATFNGTTAILYVDGNEVARASMTGQMSSNTAQPFVVGNFIGTLDELAVYNTALSATRVTAHYSAGKAVATGMTSSLSSTGLARLPVIDSTKHAALTLGNPSTGVHEIVWVLDHAASATVATVLRGQEGSTARAWPTGTQWMLAPTAADFDGGSGGPANAGTTIHSGTGVPQSTVGVTGDYFLSTDTSRLYGPKPSDSGWGASTSPTFRNATTITSGTSIAIPSGTQVGDRLLLLQSQYGGATPVVAVSGFTDLNLTAGAGSFGRRSFHGPATQAQLTAGSITVPAGDGAWHLLAYGNCDGVLASAASTTLTSPTVNVPGGVTTKVVYAHNSWGGRAPTDTTTFLTRATSTGPSLNGATTSEASSSGPVAPVATYTDSGNPVIIHQIVLQPAITAQYITLKGETGAARSFESTFKGAWAINIPYLQGDLVTYQGSTYVAAVGNTGQMPTDPASWTVVATAGAAAGSVLTFTDEGALEIVSGTTRVYNDSGAPRTLRAVRASLTTVGSSPTVVDIHLDGSTIFPTQVQRPYLAADVQSVVATPGVTVWPEGGWLSVDVDTAGTGAKDLVVQVTYT